MLSMNYIKDEENYYKQKIKELTEKDEYNTRRSQRQQKEIERLTAESTEWESKCYKYQDVINELEKYLEHQWLEWRDDSCDEISAIANEDKAVLDKLKELKEGK